MHVYYYVHNPIKNIALLTSNLTIHQTTIVAKCRTEHADTTSSSQKGVELGKSMGVHTHSGGR